jgi:LytS/YehU family sensor histidine kinase
MIIQPFVENAIIHGLAPKDGEGCIKVNFIMERDSVKVIVDDNGVGRKNRQHKSHVSRGINLIRERLSILNSKNETKYGLKIIDKEGDKPGTRVELSL